MTNSDKNDASKTAREVQFAEREKVLAEVMEKNWVVLRALALADQLPEADVQTLLRIAEQQAAERVSR